jgi:hypothetical protein
VRDAVWAAATEANVMIATRAAAKGVKSFIVVIA